MKREAFKQELPDEKKPSIKREVRFADDVKPKLENGLRLKMEELKPRVKAEPGVKQEPRDSPGARLRLLLTLFLLLTALVGNSEERRPIRRVGFSEETRQEGGTERPLQRAAQASQDRVALSLSIRRSRQNQCLSCLAKYIVCYKRSTRRRNHHIPFTAKC